MAVAFVQALGSNQSKTAGTSLAISVASLTVTSGNLIAVAFSADDVGSAFGCQDNLGNTYTLLQTEINATHVKTMLFTAPVTAAGTLTSITISWTTNVTAKAMVAAEFSGLNNTAAEVDSSSANSPSTGTQIRCAFGSFNPAADNLVIYAAGIEDNNPDVNTAAAPTITPNGTFSSTGYPGKDGTDGGGSASNITVILAYGIVSAGVTNGSAFAGGCSSTPGTAGVVGRWNPAAAGSHVPPRRPWRFYSRRAS